VDDDAATGDSYRFTRDMTGRTLWERVEGGDLPMPVEIALQQAPDGRYVFAGLRIGDEHGEYDEYGRLQEITSATLRQIKLGEILAAHFEHFEPIRQIEASLAEISVPLRQHSRGPAPPDDRTLWAFAQTYQAELARQPHRAMTAAAKAHSVSRTTANRWAAECRRLGYLHGTSSGEEPSS
jgi:hypothetical protein